MSKLSTITQHGYLVIADISGYTSFVAKTELEHSHEILTELLELLVSRFQPGKSCQDLCRWRSGGFLSLSKVAHRSPSDTRQS